MTSFSPEESCAQDSKVVETDGFGVLSLELLASRICHDLISPVGAIHNGVEFLEEMGDDVVGDATDLIAMSANQAAARLQAFRMAYGSGGDDSNLKPADVHKIFEELIAGNGKITQDWKADDNLGFDSYPGGYCKMLMGLLMLAQECLPKGGSVIVRADNSAEGTEIVATGTNAGFRPMVTEALEAKISPEALDPRLIHPYVMAIFANHYGFSIGASADVDTVVFSLKKI